MVARFCLLSASLIFSASPVVASALPSALWGNRSARLVPLDVATGALGPISDFSAVHKVGYSDLAGDPSWQGALVWGVSDFGMDRRLAALNPASLEVETVVTISGSEQIMSLAIDPLTGEFYGGSATSLYRIAIDTGIASLVGPTALPVGKALGFDSAGNLYGIANENQLVAVDKASGATSLVSTLNVYRMEDIAVRPETGVMYGIGYGPTYSLYQIDLTSGASVNLGPSISRPSGLAFAAVPEPAAVSLAFLTFAGCLLHRRAVH